MDELTPEQRIYRTVSRTYQKHGRRPPDTSEQIMCHSLWIILGISFLLTCCAIVTLLLLACLGK